MQHFSIIIPTLNEERNILPLLQKIEIMSSANRLRPEIIFIDDDSDDSTCEIIQSYSGPLDVRLIERKDERGLAGAVVTGAQASAHEHLVVMDADLSHPPEQIPELIEPLRSGAADMVIGSRYLKKATISSWPITRKMASLTASFPARLLTGINDPLSGFFAVRKEYLKNFATNMPGFKIGLELLVSPDPDFKVVEVPITFVNRVSGSSKMNPTVVSSYVAQLARISKLSIPGISIITVICFSLVAAAIDLGLAHFFSVIGQSPATAHIFSYLLALHCSYLLFYFLKKGHNTISSSQYHHNGYWRFLCFISAMLFLRGGILGLLIPDLSVVTPQLSMLLVGTTCAVWVLSIPVFSKSFVFRQKAFGWRPAITLLVIYTICLRLLYMGSAELIQEEAYYWNYAQHLDWGYLDHPPGVAVLIKIGTLLFGDTEFGVRFGAILCWAITTAFVWGFTRSLFGHRTAFVSLLFTATLPMFFGTSLLMTPDAPLIACWAGSLFFFQRALVQHKRYSWFGGGICLGLGLFSKYTIVFLGPSLILFMLVDPQSRRYFFSPLPYISALLAILVFSPVILWNFSNGWASFLFQSQGRLASSPEFSLHELIASVILLITPIGILGLFKSFDPYTYANIYKSGKTESSTRNWLFCLTLTLMPLSVFIIFSIFREIKLNWTAPIWLTIVPVFALVLFSGYGRKNILPWYHEARLWPGMITLLLIFYGGFLHFFTLGLPGLPFPREPFMIGWRDLASQFEDLIQTSESKSGNRPVVVGMDKYRVASGLAFYRSSLAGEVRGQVISETTGRHLFWGRGSVMYSHWHQPYLFYQKDMIVVSSKSEQLVPSVFIPYSGTIGPLESITIDKHGKEVGSVYFRRLKEYTPRQSEVSQK